MGSNYITRVAVLHHHAIVRRWTFIIAFFLRTLYLQVKYQNNEMYAMFSFKYDLVRFCLCITRQI